MRVEVWLKTLHRVLSEFVDCEIGITANISDKFWRKAEMIGHGPVDITLKETYFVQQVYDVLYLVVPKLVPHHTAAMSRGMPHIRSWSKALGPLRVPVKE